MYCQYVLSTHDARRERSSVHRMDISRAERQQKNDEKKQKRRTSAEPTGLDSRWSVYTGRDKVTIENHLKFVSLCHK